MSKNLFRILIQLQYWRIPISVFFCLENLTDPSVSLFMTFFSELNKIRLGGLLILLIGVLGNIYNWYQVLNTGKFFVKASILFPFFALLGLSIILYPMTKEERIAKFGTEQIPLSGYPLGQKILVGLGLLIGILQWVWLQGLV